jgi:hypothetical protein
MKELCDDLASRIQAASAPDPADQRHFTKLSQLLSDAQLPTAEFSAMARAFLR